MDWNAFRLFVQGEVDQYIAKSERVLDSLSFTAHCARLGEQLQRLDYELKSTASKDVQDAAKRGYDG
jgi:hypothetical protein